MDKFLINGGKALRGRLAISGAKNSALPVMAAALLTAGKKDAHNIPKVRDLIHHEQAAGVHGRLKVSVTGFRAAIYEDRGRRIESRGGRRMNWEDDAGIGAHAGTVDGAVGNGGVSAAGRMRDRGAAVDLQLEGAWNRWARRSARRTGTLKARAPKGRLKGTHIVLKKFTVTGTENILMARRWRMEKRAGKCRRPSRK